MTLRDCFAETFLRLKDKTALTFLRGFKAETQLTYGDLERDGNRMANFLMGLGVKKGDRVILFFPKSVLFVVVQMALLKMGAVGVPLNTGFKKSEMEYFVQDADPALIISGIQESFIV
jgi:acyl-coenzyme A synthetase/AMP-(fatty) acid ligase